MSPLPGAALAGRPFLKMNGLGNDFVVMDLRAESLRPDAASVRALSARQGGIGCDQFIVLEPSARADVFMRIFNPDGSEAGACGNATRCVAVLAAIETGKPDPVVETRAGLLAARLEAVPDAVETAGLVSVDMGRPGLAWDAIPLAYPVADIGAVVVPPLEGVPALGPAACVSMGNPHAVFFVDDPYALPLEAFGPLLERHPLFPDRANISLVAVASRDRLVQRVWERGAGITLACGSGACAAAVAAALTGRTDRTVMVALPGGELGIAWTADDRVWMTGPVTLDYRGTIDPAMLPAEAA